MALSNDRFNLLPESVLLIILSMLPFKDMVRTSVLSRRWNEALKSFPNIELDEDIFVKPDEPQETMIARRNAFMAFADSWIGRYRELVVEKFSLKITMSGTTVQFVIRCIMFAAQRFVKELNLDFAVLPNLDNEDNISIDFFDSFEFPVNVYALIGGTLEYMKLYACSLDDNYLHHFHALREVSLGWMEVSNESLMILLSNCENFEALSLKRCWNEDGFDLGDYGMRLRKLVIDKCNFHFDLFKLTSPFLRVFKYYGEMYCFFIEYEFVLLEEVELDFYLEYGYEEYGDNLYDFVDALHSATVLTVCSCFLQVVPSGEQAVRLEHDMNVRHLILKTALHDDEFYGIAFMLNSCPSLEHLTIQLCPPKFLVGYEPPIDVDHHTFWRNHVCVYTCVLFSVKEVEIKGFKGSLNEVMILTHFITHGRVMKKMIVNVAIDDEDGAHGGGDEEENPFLSFRRSMAEILLSFPKASNDLAIIII